MLFVNFIQILIYNEITYNNIHFSVIECFLLKIINSEMKQIKHTFSDMDKNAEIKLS